MQTIPFSEARAHLAHALRCVEAGDQDAVFISRRGHAAGVLISVAHYQQLTGKPLGFVNCLHHWRNDCMTNLLPTKGAVDDDPFANLRQTDTLRDFAW